MRPGFRLGLLACSYLVGGAIAPPVLAAPSADAAVEVRLTREPMADALVKLARQTNVQILFTSDLVAGRMAPAVSGRMSAAQALSQLLSGEDLAVQRMGVRLFVLRRAIELTPVSATSAPLLSRDSRALDGSQTTDSPTLSAATPPVEEPVELSEIVVGTHLRGVKDSASPVIVIDREMLDRAGRANVAEALAALPQTFNGTASEDTTSTGADPLGTNSSRAVGVNLRGLGADATLVLVNGRRLAGTGLKGDFSDVSSIPMAAVERVEVLLDGASALYGSDAVGGVVNIVLRKRYEGAETRMATGGAARGGASQWSLGQTAGKAWESGTAVFSYEHSARDRVRAADRDFAGQADLRSQGGTDHRRYYSSPGTIMRANASGVLVPTYAIPAGQDGTGLTTASFTAGTINLENQQGAYDVLPRQRRDSLYIALAQDLTPGIELTGDARATRRHFTNRGVAASTTLTVTSANPYFVSPTGRSSEQIAYSFQRELGGQRVNGTADTLGLSLGANARLPAGWRLETYGAYGVELMHSLTNNLLNSTYLSEALGRIADDSRSAFSTARDGYFNPFIGQGSNSKAVLDFVGSGYVDRKTRGETASVNFKVDGSLWSLPAGDIALALGGQVRREGLKTGGKSHLSGYVATPISYKASDRTVDALFSELRVPLFGGEAVRPGLRRLELSAAVRREDYGSGMASTDPKLGVIWSPLDGATLKGSWGTSFRAPSLTEVNDPQIFAPTTIVNGGTETIVMILYGGNPDLKPETATSRALTLELAPPSLPRLHASATLFETRFKNRIGQPGNEYIDQVLSSDEFANFVTYVSPATNAADRARIQALIDDPRSYAQGVFPAEAYGAIVDGRYVNTGELRVRGLDVSARYEARLGADPLRLSADLSWLIDYERKITPTSQAVERAGFVSDPADLRARFAATWSHGALDSTLALNRVGDLTIDGGGGGHVKAWTTADLNLTYVFGAGRLQGTRMALNIQNLFDQDPPFYDSPLSVGYDPTNADPLGRVVSLQLVRTW